MVTLPDANYVSDPARTQGELKQALEDIRQFIEDRFGKDSSLLIRSKNRFINGNFDLWQRGGTLTISNTTRQLLADRWNSQLFGTPGSLTITRQSFATGQTDVPGNPQYFLRAQQTAQSSGGCRVISQRIENVTTFAGQKSTLSFYAKADAAQEFRAQVQQYFGSGMGASPSVYYDQDFQVIADWQKFAFTYDLADLASKTIQSPGNRQDYLAVQINEPNANATFTLDVARMQFEPGEGATPFDERDPGEEYTLASRYFAKSYRLEVPPGTIPDLNGVAVYVAQNAGAAENGQIIYLPVKMRTIPTVTYYNPHAANTKWRNTDLGADSGLAQSLGTGEDRFGISNPQVAGDRIGDNMNIHWTADAEL